MLTGIPSSGNGRRVPQKFIQTIEAGQSLRSQASAFAVHRLRGDGVVSVASLRLGWHAEIGWLLAASWRADFPTATERLLLGVTANQAVISLQGASLLREQKQVAEQLDQAVKQRTQELQAASSELERALSQIHELKDKLKRENAILRMKTGLSRGGLAPWQLRRAKDLMHSNLDRHVPLSRLAEESGLSVRHFARAFRQSTGLPPHRWLLNHRVEQTKELLRNPALSLADVALACGTSLIKAISFAFSLRLLH